MADSEAPIPDGPRLVLVDALNVAWWCGAPPSLRLPLALLTHLLDAGREAVLYFDANARHVLGGEAELYGRIARHSRHVVEAPSGTRADGLMLKHAAASGACVVSRDKYRDYRKRYRRVIDDPARLFAGWVANDRIVVPGLSIDDKLPESADPFVVHLRHFT